MVTVFFRGGLGNQMFQYALGLHLAKKNETDLILDTVHVSDRFPRTNFTYRTFDLDIFSLTPHFTVLSRLARTVPLPGVWLGLDLLRMGIKENFTDTKVIYEDGRKGFDASVLQASGDVILFGHWENEKYFSGAANEVRAAFRFRRSLEGEAARVADHMRTVDSVSLHARRGDLVKLQSVQTKIGALNVSYYERAVAHISKHLKRPHFFVFSDDVRWAKENIKLKFPATYLDNSTAGPKASYHLQLMSLCKHNIIANSAFSWWGAWLNHNPNKVVIAPARWFADGRETGVVPATWVSL